MTTSEGTSLLQAGISAIRSGDRETARALLMKVVEADERNEHAWLWLSTVVETVEDQRICLENVLSLNPGSKIALEKLAELEDGVLDVSVGTDTVGQATAPGLSKPERVQATQAAAAGPSGSEVDGRGRLATSPADVWDTEDDICAYCATRVNQEDTRCPGCHRVLTRLHYRYPATAALHFFWVLLFTLGIILFFQALFAWSVEGNGPVALLHLVLAGLLMPLVIGVYLRLFAAHVSSVFVLIAIVILSVYDLFRPFDLSLLSSGSGVDPIFRGFTAAFLERLALFGEVVQTAVAGLSLFYALLRAGPEFDRVKERSIARLGSGLHTAVDYHMAARRYGQEDMWASAVLHWRRAAAIDPTKAAYQRDLAKAYLRLGFLERGLRVLHSAQKLPMPPDLKAEVAKLTRLTEARAGMEQGIHGR